MENIIEWETNLVAAIDRAQGDNKPVFLDFHNPK